MVKRMKRVTLKPSGFTPAVKKASKAKKGQKIQKLRKSITPGTVVIPVAGQFKGSRVVVLKQLEKSGLLLVTGPYALNGVPLRRMNQRFVIATSTKINVSGVKTEKFTDEYFKKSAADKLKGKDAFLEAATKSGITDARKADQKTVDSAILSAVSKDVMMKKYLKSKFALTNNMMAHELKF